MKLFFIILFTFLVVSLNRISTQLNQIIELLDDHQTNTTIIDTTNIPNINGVYIHKEEQ